jgi:hypothetical protein
LLPARRGRREGGRELLCGGAVEDTAMSTSTVELRLALPRLQLQALAVAPSKSSPPAGRIDHGGVNARGIWPAEHEAVELLLHLRLLRLRADLEELRLRAVGARGRRDDGRSSSVAAGPAR